MENLKEKPNTLLNTSSDMYDKQQHKIWKNILNEISKKGLNINNTNVLMSHLQDNYFLVKK